MITFEEITKEEYVEMSKKRGVKPNIHPKATYQKVIRDGDFVAIRASIILSHIETSRQFIINPEYKGNGGYIMKQTIKTILDSGKTYQSFWNSKVLTILNGFFKNMTITKINSKLNYIVIFDGELNPKETIKYNRNIA